MRTHLTKSLLALAASTLATGSAVAATDGTLGATSTGSVTITATVPQPANPTGAKISGLQDINLGSPSPGAGIYDWSWNATRQICIYHSSPTVRLTMTQSGDAPGNSALRLLGPENRAMNVSFYILFGGSTLAGFTSKDESFTGRVFNRNAQDCATGGSPTLQVNADERNTTNGGPAPGTYTGMFQIVVANE